MAKSTPPSAASTPPGHTTSDTTSITTQTPDNVIGETLVVQGRVEFKNLLRIDGHFEGASPSSKKHRTPQEKLPVEYGRMYGVQDNVWLSRYYPGRVGHRRSTPMYHSRHVFCKLKRPDGIGDVVQHIYAIFIYTGLPFWALLILMGVPGAQVACT